MQSGEARIEKPASSGKTRQGTPASRATSREKKTRERIPRIHPRDSPDARLRSTRDAAGFLLNGLLAHRVVVAMAAGIAASGSHLSYHAGLPLSVPLAVLTAAMTAAWMLDCVATLCWISGAGRRWREERRGRAGQPGPEAGT